MEDDERHDECTEEGYYQLLLIEGVEIYAMCDTGKKTDF